ncbi:MAG TPA: hypothetical protein VFT04_05775 [Gemmatimonadales bacterium]|nr:hypothetical protein [Gemmatimonadales bacterium]
MPITRPRSRAALAAAALLALAGCASVGQFLEEAMRERPPAAIDRMTTASDARIDSAGRLVGSFVGEGTNRAVHLLSSDTALIAELVRRYAPRRTTEPWDALSKAGLMRIPLRTGKEDAARGPLVQLGRVGSPEGRTGVIATSLLLRSGRCGWRGSQVELVVEEARREAGPALRGPVIGSLVTSRTQTAPDGFIEREPLPAPDDALVRELVDRTRRAIDSSLAAQHPTVRARPVSDRPIEINSLGDIDAGDVTPFHVGDGRVRYAVSLRERRVQEESRDTLVAAGVMVWDEAGTWQQFVFRPAYLVTRRGRLAPFRTGRAHFWRRLGAVSDFGFDRDNLWMEQVDVRDGTVLWGIIQPSDNVVVAAAEMEGECMVR